MGLKSIFDGLYVNQLIQKNERGETIIYPHGIIGRGYVLPAEREPAMRQRVRTLMLVSLSVGIAFGMFLLRVDDSENAVTPLGWVVIAGIGALLLAAIVYFQRRLASGLQPAPGPRPSPAEWLRRGRQSRATWTYWFTAVLGLIMAPLSAASIGVGVGDGDLIVIVCGVLLLGASVLAVWDGMLGLKERRRATG